MDPLPIFDDGPGGVTYMSHVGDAWKTPEKLAEYTATGFVDGFLDSYRMCASGSFGFRAPPSYVLTGNWRSVLTRRIGDVLEPNLAPVPRERRYDPTPDFPLTRLRIHAARPDAPHWQPAVFTATFAKGFLAGMRWPRTSLRGYTLTDCAISLRIYDQSSSWACIVPDDYAHAGTCAVFCACPRADAVAWVNAFSDLNITDTP